MQCNQRKFGFSKPKQIDGSCQHKIFSCVSIFVNEKCVSQYNNSFRNFNLETEKILV